MAVADLHGTQTVDTKRLPMGWAATKMVASFVSILFSIATFIVPSRVGKLYTAAVAVVFMVFSLVRPLDPKVRRKLLTWVAIVFTTAAVVVAVYTAIGAVGPVEPQVKP